MMLTEVLWRLAIAYSPANCFHFFFVCLSFLSFTPNVSFEVKCYGIHVSSRLRLDAIFFALVVAVVLFSSPTYGNKVKSWRQSRRQNMCVMCDMLIVAVSHKETS